MGANASVLIHSKHKLKCKIPIAQTKMRNVSGHRVHNPQMTEMKLHRSHLEIILLLSVNLGLGEFEVRARETHEFNR